MHKFQNDILAANAPTGADIDKKGRIRGYGAATGNVDRGGDMILAGAFTKTLARFKSEGLPLMCWMHDMAQPIGKWTVAREDQKGLWLEGQLNLETTAGRDAYAHVKAQDVTGLSIGYRTPKGARTYEGKGVFHLKEVDVWEVSVVGNPMNPLATIETVKTIESKSQAIDMLRGAGMSKKAATRFAAGGWSALAGGYDETKLKRLADAMDAATNMMKARA